MYKSFYLGSNLITTLASLKMDNFSHIECFSLKSDSGMSLLTVHNGRKS